MKNLRFSPRGGTCVERNGIIISGECAGEIVREKFRAYTRNGDKR